MKDNLKICICLAHNYSSFDRNFVMSLLTMQSYFYEWRKEAGKNHSLMLMVHGGYCLDKMRNAVTIEALNNNADIILYLDTDMTFPPNTIVRLLKTLEDNPEYKAVSGLYTAKKDPYVPQIFSKFDKKRQRFVRSVAFWLDNPFPIDGAGLGIFMVWADEIKKLEMPYFKFVDKGENKLIKYGMGEDLYFCWKLINNNVKIICDPQTICGHLDTRPVDLGSYVRKNKLKIKNNQIYITKEQVKILEKKSKKQFEQKETKIKFK